MKKTSLFISVVLLLSLALSACQNTGAQPTPVDENSFATLVAGTLTAVAAQAQQTLAEQRAKSAAGGLLCHVKVLF